MSAPNSGAPVSPLEAVVVRDNPYQLGMFATGTSIARRALASINPESTLTIVPLRGAMPIVWAAGGLDDLEPALDNTFIEVPLTYTHHDGSLRTASPRRNEKPGIIRAYVAQALRDGERNPADTSLMIIDEVQKGGTLGTAVEATRSVMRAQGIQGDLQVIAAQDSRRKVAAQAKTKMYRNLASNSVEHARTTVVPMPLIATDRVPLLDTITLVGDARVDSGRLAEQLTVQRNHDAETLFRSIGSMARVADVRHDEGFVRTLIDQQGIQSERASARVEGWFQRFITALDRLGLEKR